MFYNDSYLWFEYLKGTAIGLLTLFVAIICHEFGHVLYFKHIGKKVTVRKEKKTILVGQQSDYDDLTDEQYKLVNLWGILAGLLPIITIGCMLPWVFWMLIPYLWGCRADIGEMAELNEINE